MDKSREGLEQDNEKLLKLYGTLQFTVDQQKVTIAELTKHLGDCIEYIDVCENSMQRMDVLDVVSEDMPECDLDWDEAIEVFNTNKEEKG